MTNKILTPSILWNDFNDSLPLDTEEKLTTTSENGVGFYDVHFSGRETSVGRVRIFARFCRPCEGEKFPTLLVLPDARETFCDELMQRFASRGFAVLMPDYRGKYGDEIGSYTEYPSDIPYADFAQAGRHMYYADATAKETSWYEWVAVARYCVRYLKSRMDVEKIGVLGLKRGGEVAWQLMATSSDLSCGVTVCAGGWMTYRGKNKFGDGGDTQLNDERYRFLAAVDAQAYAPGVHCPVMMLNSTNDKNFDADRAFDTFARINPEMDKTFHFATRYEGYIGNSSLANLDLFMDKYLRGRAVFMPSPIEITVEEDADGELTARLTMDPNGEVTECSVYMAEDNLNSATRDWSMCPMKSRQKNEAVFRLNAYRKAKIVFAFAKAKYSCGFCVSSKIAVKRVEKEYVNLQPQSRILYNNKNGTDSFIFDRSDGVFLADSIAVDDRPLVEMIEGAHGIMGVSSSLGLKTYKISDGRYKPADNAFLKFDIYAPTPCVIEVTVKTEKEGEEVYSCSLHTGGGEKWHNHILYSKDFKNAVGKPLAQLNQGLSLSFNGASLFALNNLLWV